jgi:uncharacterized membrane protein YfcA
VSEIAGFVALGFGAGCYGTMVGLGGGFLLVPIFLFLHYPPKDAAGTSLAVVLANSISGSVSYLRQRRVDIRTALIFSAAAFPGSVLGAYVDQFIPRRVFSLILGVILLLIGARMLVGDQTKSATAPLDEPQRVWEIRKNFVDRYGVRHEYRYNVILGTLLSIGVGFISSIFGIGGGIIHVPAMIFAFNFPAHIATATSHFIIAITALIGTSSHLYYGDVLMLPALSLSTGAIGGAQLGAHLSRRLRSQRVMRWFSLAVFIAAVWLIWVDR